MTLSIERFFGGVGLHGGCGAQAELKCCTTVAWAHDTRADAAPACRRGARVLTRCLAGPRTARTSPMRTPPPGVS